MSDAGRKDWSTKAKEEITPDSSKSTLDKTKESVTDGVDRIAGETQSDSSKGAGQSAFDKGKREKDGSLLDSVKVTTPTTSNVRSSNSIEHPRIEQIVEHETLVLSLSLTKLGCDGNGR